MADPRDEHITTVLLSVTDAHISALSLRQRRELVSRLLGLVPVTIGEGEARRRRHRLLVVLIASCVGLIPWIAFLALTLPRHYVATNWEVTWIGFDVLLLSSLAVTAYLGWRGRQLVVLSSFASGLLLVCDAWFDISTADSGGDRLTAILSAALVELPLAALLLQVTYTLLRLVMSDRMGGSGALALWRLPVLVSREQR